MTSRTSRTSPASRAPGRRVADGASAAREVRLRFAAGLRFFLAARHRGEGEVRVTHDGTSSLGHVVASLGVPPTEVGGYSLTPPLTAPPGAPPGASPVPEGEPVGASYRPRDGDLVRVHPVPRPQRIGSGTSASAPVVRFVLDVHLGALARRLRLLGLSAAYHNDMDDGALLGQANAEHRVLLTQDRGLLQRRALWCGAYVRGARTGEQLRDVLERFAPPLAPWSRCTACDGLLVPVPKSEVAPLLRPGTLRTYDTFTRCPGCGRVYWRGAHGAALEGVVEEARRVLASV